MVRALTERDLDRALTGLVVESLAVEQDPDRGTVPCEACPPESDDAAVLSAGDRVAVAVSCYENHSWEIQGVYCEDHAVTAVEAAMPVRGEHQTVVTAVLERAGYHSPAGEYHPDALTLGAVSVEDYSPPADGY